MRTLRVLLCVLALSTSANSALAQATHALVVAGVSGEPRLAAEFRADAEAVRDAVVQRFGGRATLLTESSAPRSDKTSIAAALNRIASEAQNSDRVLVVLIGHGSAQGGSARFNVPGPDLTADELAQLLRPLGNREVAVVLATSASGAFVPTLQQAGRTVITATRSGAESEEVVFPRFFAQALREDVADADKDGGVSLMEAFEYAKREVARFYQQSNRLATEHAQLSDSVSARTFTLRSGPAVTGDAELAALQRQIDALRARKANMAADAYDAELERLLLELARRTREQKAQRN